MSMRAWCCQVPRFARHHHSTALECRSTAKTQVNGERSPVADLLWLQCASAVVCNVAPTPKAAYRPSPPRLLPHDIHSIAVSRNLQFHHLHFLPRAGAGATKLTMKTMLLKTRFPLSLFPTTPKPAEVSARLTSSPPLSRPSPATLVLAMVHRDILPGLLTRYAICFENR